ncbi:MAG: hypothetical protein Q7R81_04485 [Candidatus Peregrinibacteria bacterium]|nr:hypothetical protein [Candidatus Peregrinibacteria bacterium]
MNDPIANFFAQAQNIHLTETERSAILGHMILQGEEVSPQEAERQMMHMTSLANNFFDKAKSTSLHSEEKQASLAQIQSFIEKHPVKKKKRTVKGDHGSKLTEVFLSLFHIPTFSLGLATIVLLMTSTGFIASAAESAVPGDLLYPIKTGINETAIGLLYVTTEAKAEWNVRKLDRRLAEVRLILQRSPTSLGESEALLKYFEEEYTRVRSHVLLAKDRGETRIAAEESDDLELILSDHESALGNLHFREKDTALAPVLQRITTAKQSARTLRRQVEETLPDETRAALILKRRNEINTELARAEELYSGIENPDVQKKLDDVKQHIMQIDAALERGEVQQADTLVEDGRLRARAVRHAAEAGDVLEDLMEPLDPSAGGV